GPHWAPLPSAVTVGVLVSLCWNLPLHRLYVFRQKTGKQRTMPAILGAVAATLGAVAVLFVAYGNPFAEEPVQGFSNTASDKAEVTQASFLPKLLPEAFYS